MSDVLKETGTFSYSEVGLMNITEVPIVTAHSTDREGCVPPNIYKFTNSFNDIAITTVDN
jgi:hypothetical protein